MTTEVRPTGEGEYTRHGEERAWGGREEGSGFRP